MPAAKLSLSYENDLLRMLRVAGESCPTGPGWTIPEPGKTYLPQAETDRENAAFRFQVQEFRKENDAFVSGRAVLCEQKF